MTSGFYDVNNATMLSRDILTSASLSFPWRTSCAIGESQLKMNPDGRMQIWSWHYSRMKRKHNTQARYANVGPISFWHHSLASVRLISTDMTEWCRVDIKLMSGRGQPDIRIFCLCRVTETTWSHLNGAIKTINSTAIHHESPEETNDRYEKFIKKPLQNLYRNFYEKSI